jgi:hypothetical protein
MALKDLDVVYGGPYGHETDAITREINLAKETDRKPDFDAVTKDWESISQGALEFLKAEGNPDETPAVSDYVFQNVLFEEEAELPYTPEKVEGDIIMPAPLEGFIPVETYVESELPVVTEEDETDFVAPEEEII